MAPSPLWSQLPGRRSDQLDAAPGLVGWRPPWASTPIRPFRLVASLFVHIEVPPPSKCRPLSRLPPLSYEEPPSQSCAALHWLLPPVKCRPPSKNDTRYCHASTLLATPLPDAALAFVVPVARTPIRSAICHPRPGRMAHSMGVDAYQTNQFSGTTFRAYQSAAPVKMPPPRPAAAPSAECRPSVMKCRPLNHVPPLHWVLPPVKCRP